MRSCYLFAVTTLIALAGYTAPVATADQTQALALRQRILVGGQTNAWPSLRFEFSIKRSSMEVHGQADFSVLASPAVSTHGDSSILYDAFATFTEASTVFNYTLVEGTAYVSRSNVDDSTSSSLEECDDTDILPSINSIVSALNEAVPVSSISSSSSGAIDCATRDTFKVSANGIDLGLCFSGSSGFTMHGSDMNVKVEYLEDHESIVAPTVDGGACENVASPTAVTSTGRALLTGAPLSSREARRLKAASINFDFSFDDEECSCKSTPRPCIFIHGLGVKSEEPENLDVFPTKYLGNLTGHAPCCSSMKYAMLNTVNNSWTDDAQQRKVCDRALDVSETSQDSTISDTIIVTHSMGNLMLAGAIASGKCSLDSSVSWVGLSGPLRGSMASNYFQDSCQNDTNFLAEDLVAKTGYCPPDEGIKSLAYEHEDYSSRELDAAYAAAQKAYRRSVNSVMCSNRFSGLRSKRQWWYWMLGTVVPHKSPKNDGMVEFYSCAGGLPTEDFGDSYEDQFYVTKLNHADTAFRNGDALLSKSKMPVKWFECLL